MTSWRRRVFSYVAVAALLAAAAVLGVLQYRWSEQAATAQRERMRRDLNQAADRFRRDLSDELLPVCRALTEGERYFETWRRTARRPELVTRVFHWTPELGRDGRRVMGCILVTEIPALVRATPPGPDGPPEYLAASLNAAYFEKTVLAELAQRHFSGPDATYRVEVRGGKIAYQSSSEAIVSPDLRTPLAGPPPEFIPPQDRGPGPGFGPPPRMPPGDGRRGPPPGGFRGFRGGPPGRGPGRGPGPGGPPRGRPDIILSAMGQPPWQLIVKHSSGSLEAVIAADRERNLLFGFGALSVLTLGALMLLFSTLRAQQLARLQMDFVAGVSHELRTPLSVICSAGDNLADGKVLDAPQVAEYGRLVRDEGRRLGGMVEQILQFSAMESGRRHFDLRPVNLAETIEETLADCDSLIRSSGFTVERDLESGLPAVNADRAALKQCLQNLVANAVKYGGDARWARVLAKLSGREVRVTVEDRGMGIDPGDLPRVFEPFFRGDSARNAQIHGTGLGLSLARSFAAAMGGRLEVESQPGRGSAFTLILPAAKGVS